MNRRAKKKKKQRLPPLSAGNKALYVFLFLLLAAALVLLAWGWFRLLDAMAFRDPAVLACRRHSSACLAFPLGIYLLLSGEIVLLSAYDSRIPILGRPHPSRFRRTGIRLWLVGLVLCLLLVPLSLFGRDCLRQDGSVVSYNLCNQVHETQSGFTRLTVSTETGVSRSGLSFWYYAISLETGDGQRYSFSRRDFPLDSTDDAILTHMLEIKDRFPAGSITAAGSDDLDRVVRSLRLNARQQALLYALFQV